MKRMTKIALTAGAALSIGLAAVAVAQPYGYGGPGWGMGYGMHGNGPGWGGTGGYGMGPGMMYGYSGYGMGPGMMYGYGPRARFGGSYGNVDDNLANLKSQLGITTKQEGAWNDFAKTARQQSESRRAWYDKLQQARAAGSAPEALEQQADFAKQRQAEIATNAAALKKLYGALTPEQKQIADASFGGYGPGYCLQAFGGPNR